MPEVEETAAGAQTEIADCDGCKWMMGFGYNCLLGRSAERCTNNPARRGDDELIERILALSVVQQDDLKRRFEAGEGARLQELRAEESADDL